MVKPGAGAAGPTNGDWKRYLDFLDTQLGELLTNYGAVGGIWFDGMWDKPNADWRLQQTYALIHRLQPAALIIPNHHKAPLPGEDVQTFEQDLPGANTAGFNTTEIGTLPTETSLTMNGSWGFNITDRNFKSVRELVGTLVRAAGTGTNLLLNIGPRPDGTIDPEFIQRLQAMGQWLSTIWPIDLRDPGGPDPSAVVGGDDSSRRHRLCPRPVVVRSAARRSTVRRARQAGDAPRRRTDRAVRRDQRRHYADPASADRRRIRRGCGGGARASAPMKKGSDS